MRVGVVEEKLVDGEKPVSVRVLIVCVRFQERIERHRGDVRRQGVSGPLVPAQGCAREEVCGRFAAETREVVAEGEPSVREELDLEGDRLARVAVEKHILPSDDKRIVRGDAIPHLAWSVNLVEQFPICLRHNAERRHERSEPVVRGYCTVHHPNQRLDFAEGVDAQTRDIVRGDLERPVRECGVNPVVRRAKRPPVGDDGRVGRRREVELLARSDASHHESACEVRRLNGVRRIRRGDWLESEKVEGCRLVDRMQLRVQLSLSVQALKLSARQRHRIEVARSRHHLRHVVRSTANLCAAGSVERRGHQPEHYDADKRQLLREAGNRPKRPDASCMRRNADPCDKARRSRQNNRRSPYLRQHGVTSALWRATGTRCRT